MAAKIEFFPVGNGDMTLVTLESGRTILIDVNIRKVGDDENDDETVDVASLLRDRLERDAEGRLYVDAFLLSHPDEDHCRGLIRHFHLGDPDNWVEKEDKILIREMWSSPIIFRRKNDVEKLCEDAEAWWKEARRRVQEYKDAILYSFIDDGDKIQILGEDSDGKTDDLNEILVKTDTEISKICGNFDGTFKAWLLAPQVIKDKQVAENLSGKNHSSTIIRFSLKEGYNTEACLFLAGGDAHVENWERVWDRNYEKTDRLQYDLLLAPHHCSWHSLSYDSWSEHKEKAKVSEAARNALSQAKDQAFIISSSNEIKDDDNDPPCIRAKREYKAILQSDGVAGTFLCTTEECDDDVLLFEVTADGLKKSGSGENLAKMTVGVTTKPRMTDKKGGGRYA